MLAMSQLDHDLNDLNESEMLEAFANDETKGYPDIAEKEKVYIAGLAEYIYHKAGRLHRIGFTQKSFISLINSIQMVLRC